MTVKHGDNHFARILIAGDRNIARQVCREFCYTNGDCVNVRDVDFIYTGGEESGVEIEFVQYPRFPRTAAELEGRAFDLANLLLERLCQHSYLLHTSTRTLWKTKREN